MATVCSILSDACFFEAPVLADSCMLYLSCNMETALESSYLDDLSPDLIARLTAFCRKRQLARLPISRSGTLIDDLMAKHFDFLAELDLPRPSTGKRRWRIAPRSPRFPPADLPMGSSPPLTGAYGSSLLSQAMSPSPSLGSTPIPRPPPPPATTMRSPTLSPTRSPAIVAAQQSDEQLFAMDDLNLGDAGSPPASPQLSELDLSPPPRMWARKPAEASPVDLRSIMAAQSRRPVVPRSAVKAMPPSSSSPSPASTGGVPWKSRTAEAAKVSLVSVQAEETARRPSTSGTSTPVRPPAPQRPSGSFARPLQTPSPARPTVTVNPASAVGVPVISPARAPPPRRSLGSSGPADAAWTQPSTSAFFAPHIASPSPPAASIASPPTTTGGASFVPAAWKMP